MCEFKKCDCKPIPENVRRNLKTQRHLSRYLEAVKYEEKVTKGGADFGMVQREHFYKTGKWFADYDNI